MTYETIVNIEKRMLSEYVQMRDPAPGVYNLAPTRREQEMAAGYFDNVVGTVLTDNTA